MSGHNSRTSIPRSKTKSPAKQAVCELLEPRRLMTVTAAPDSLNVSIIRLGETNVLANDTDDTGTINPSSVTLVSQPAHGVVGVDGGNAYYEPYADFAGADSFTYTVADSNGDVSDPALVSVDVQAAPLQLRDSVDQNLHASGGIIDQVRNALFADYSTIAVVTPPAHGTTSVDSVTGRITYVPAAGFIGVDSFSYDAKNLNGLLSNTATATMVVKAPISDAKGGVRSIAFVNGEGVSETINLNIGTADVVFSGRITSVARHGGTETIAGTNLEIANIKLSDTTNASVLSVQSAGNRTFPISQITDPTTPLGSINAPAATLTGDVTLAGLSSLNVGSIQGAGMTIDRAGAQQITLTVGTVTSWSLTSRVAIGVLKVGSWSTTDNPLSVAAPSFGSIVSAGDFDGGIFVTAPTAALGIGSLRVAGTLAGNIVDGGGAGSICVNAVAPKWSATFGGAVSLINIKTGDLTGDITAGSVGSINIKTGDLTGDITAGSARSIHVAGAISNANIYVTTPGGLGELVASSLVHSIVMADVDGFYRIDSQLAEDLGTNLSKYLGSATIGSIRLTGLDHAQFVDSIIMARNIRSLSLGMVDTTNDGNIEGIGASNVGTVNAVFGGKTIHPTRDQLDSQATLDTYLAQQNVAFGDFKIVIP